METTSIWQREPAMVIALIFAGLQLVAGVVLVLVGTFTDAAELTAAGIALITTALGTVATGKATRASVYATATEVGPRTFTNPLQPEYVGTTDLER